MWFGCCKTSCNLPQEISSPKHFRSTRAGPPVSARAGDYSAGKRTNENGRKLSFRADGAIFFVASVELTLAVQRIDRATGV